MALFETIKQRLVLTGIVLGVVTGAPSAASADDSSGKEREGAQNLVTAQGYGEVKVRPDAVRVNVGIETRTRTLNQARAQVNTKAQQIIEALKALRIPNATLQTQTIQYYPVYSTKKGDAPPKIIGYSATNQVQVTVLGEDPNEIGEYASRILDAAQKRGANVVGGIEFFLRDSGPATRTALAAAVEDATHNAQAMVDAAKVRLIKLHSLQAQPSAQDSSFRFAAAKMARSAPTPVETGELVFSSSVTARFRFTR